jgi:uncharacterized protein (TIGR02271 family)
VSKNETFFERRKFVTTTGNPIAVGVFQDETQAQQAMSDLQQVGFTDSQIRYSVHKGGAGILDSLTSLGIPQQEASYYNSEFEAGRTVVTVNTSDRQQEAFDILSRNGGYSATTGMGQSTATYGQAADTYAQERTFDTDSAERVQLREEQLQVNKQPVQTGEVGIRKEVVTEQKSINVPVNREEVVIERRPVSNEVSNEPISEGETIRIPVSEEQVNVSKQTVATGEVAIGKRQVQETQQVSEAVRREKAHIEREGNVSIHNTKTDPYHPSQTDVEDLLEDH